MAEIPHPVNDVSGDDEDANRREAYRFRFDFLSRPKAELIRQGSAVRFASLTDLSMGGAAVLSPEPLPEGWGQENCCLRFKLASRSGPPVLLTFLCRIVHVRAVQQGHRYGLHFVGLDAPARERERRALWQFLLEKQRQSHADSLAAETRGE